MRYVDVFQIDKHTFKDFDSMFLWLQMIAAANSNQDFNVVLILVDKTQLNILISYDLYSDYNYLWLFVVSEIKRFGGPTLYRKIDEHKRRVVLYVNKNLPEPKIGIYREKTSLFKNISYHRYHYGAISEKSLNRMMKYCEHTYWEYVYFSDMGGTFYFHMSLEHVYQFITNAFTQTIRGMRMDSHVLYFMLLDFLIRHNSYADKMSVHILQEIFKSLTPGSNNANLDFDELLNLLPYDYVSDTAMQLLNKISKEYREFTNKVVESLDNERALPERIDIVELRTKKIQEKDSE